MTDSRISCPKPDAHLWRYMSFGNFVCTIQTGQLYFPNFTSFEDKYEGMPTRAHLDYMRSVAEGARVKETERLEADIRRMRDLRPYFFVNCWSENPDESAALWSYYTRHTETVAIRTTVAALCESLAAEERSILVGSVQYVDYRTVNVEDPNFVWGQNFLKRKSFAFEREFRAVLEDFSGWTEPADRLSRGERTSRSTSADF